MLPKTWLLSRNNWEMFVILPRCFGIQLRDVLWYCLGTRDLLLQIFLLYQSPKKHVMLNQYSIYIGGALFITFLLEYATLIFFYLNQVHIFIFLFHAYLFGTIESTLESANLLECTKRCQICWGTPILKAYKTWHCLCRKCGRQIHAWS